MHDIFMVMAQCATDLVSICAPIIAYALLRQLGLQNDEAARAIVTTAITRGAGLAIAEGLKRGDPLLTKETTKNPALQSAVAYVQAAAGPQLGRLKIDGDMLGQKLASQLALTLHVPTVQANAGVATTPPANVTPAVVAPIVAATLPLPGYDKTVFRKVK